jgi:hypothetical protein
MECTVNTEDLKILLLKCVGSKHPIKLVLKNNDTFPAHILGFTDADCTVVKLFNDKISSSAEMNIGEIRRVETVRDVTLDRIRSKVFNIN